MQNGKPTSFLNLNWQELIFLFAYFFILPLVSELQYRSLFPDRSPLGTYLIYHFLTTFISCLPLLFYYLAIVPFLFRKKYVLVMAYTLLYLIGNDFYLRYAVDLLVAKMRFLPEDVWTTALGAYNHSKEKLIRQSIYISLMDLFVLFTLAYFISAGKQEKELLNLRKKRMLSELDYLKTQINPSFFFNTLHNVHSLALKGSAQTALVIAHLSEVMRYMLYQPATKVLLQKELDFTLNYLEAERSRLENRSNIEFDVQGKTENLIIESLTLIPFIELALNSTTEQQSTIAIVIVISGLELTMEIRANHSFSTSPCHIIKRLELLYPQRNTVLLNQHEISLNLQLDHEH